MGEGRDSRVLVFSQRHLAREVWHAAQFEFEDLLDSIDDVSVLSPRPQRHQQVRTLATRVTNGVRTRVGVARHLPLWRSPSMTPTKVSTSHDLFFGVFHHAHQLAYLHRLDGWRERSSRAVCLLVELWTPGIRAAMDYLQVLKDFDQVYVTNPALVHELPRQLGIRAPKYLYMGVDALKMSPLPRMPERVVDVYSYGRRAPVTHSALLDLVDQKGLMYVYDSLQDGRLEDHREHRSLLANIMKRSRFFLAHRINDSPRRQGRTGGDESPSTRFYEGVAGGAVLLGSRPQTPEFDVDFPWDDAVVPFPWDSAEIGDAIADLERQPERLARIRAANVAGSLRTHDWAYRWGEILRDVDLSPLAGTDTRLEALAAMAGDVTPELFLDTRRRS